MVAWKYVGVGSAIIILVVVGLYVVLRPSDAPVEQHSFAAHADIVLSDTGYIPREIWIKKGGDVTFTTTRNTPFWPASDPHPTHTIDSAFDPREPVPPNRSWTHQFDTAGTWRYHDHLRSYYDGVIYVEE